MKLKKLDLKLHTKTELFILFRKCQAGDICLVSALIVHCTQGKNLFI